MRHDTSTRGVPWPVSRELRRQTRQHLPCVLLLLWAVLLLAPPAFAAKNEWLPVAPEDLALKDNPADPGSHAMVLYSETVHDLEERFTSYYVRTKIFDQDGMKFARVEDRTVGQFQVIEDFHARTIHPDGSVVDFAGEPVPESRLGLGGRYSVEVFTLPEVTPGSIVEYRYRRQFHPERLPSRQVRYLPPSANINQLLTQSRHFYWPAQGELFTRTARFIVHPQTGSWMPSGSPDYRTDNLPAGTVVTVKAGHLLCDASNVPAQAPLDFPPPARDLQGHIEMYYRQHKPETEKQYWGQFAAGAVDFEKKFLGSNKLARQIVAQIVQPGDSPEAKLRKLYARSQALRNLSFEPMPPEEELKHNPLEPSENVDDVLRHGTGLSSEINLTFVALARAAGFEANSVHLASRNIQTFDMHRFDSSQLNTTAVWVRLADTEVLLDPGTPLCPYGMLPWQKSLSGGLRLMKESWKWLATPTPRPRDSRIERSAELQLSPEGKLRGTMHVRLFGQEALELRLQNLGLSEEERANHLSARIRECLPGDVSIEHFAARGWDSSEGPLSADFQISIPTAAAPDHGVLLPLFVSVAGQRKLFEGPARNFPVHFNYPFEEVDGIGIALPSGMTWEHPLPRQGFTFDVPGMRISPPVDSGIVTLRRRTPGEVAGAAFESSSALLDSSLMVKRTLLVAVDVVPGDKYSELRNFFIGVRAADAEKVALRRAVAVPH